MRIYEIIEKELKELGANGLMNSETNCQCKNGCYTPGFEPKYNQKCQPAYKWRDGIWRTEKEEQ